MILVDERPAADDGLPAAAAAQARRGTYPVTARRCGDPCEQIVQFAVELSVRKLSDQGRRVMSQVIGDSRTYDCGFGCCHFGGLRVGPLAAPVALVVAAGIDGELPEEFAGDRVDDADVEVLDEQEDVGSGVGSANADVAESAGHAQGDVAGLADPVVADPVVGVGVTRAAG